MSVAAKKMSTELSAELLHVYGTCYDEGAL